LAASKKQQLCEISSIFELGNVKNKANQCRADGLVPMRFTRLPLKSEPGQMKCLLHLSRKIILANLKI